MSEEKKPEAKKPEAVAPKKTLLESTVDSILGMDKEVMVGKVPSVKGFSKFDELRQDMYEATFERNLKIRDPSEKHNQLARTFMQIKQESGYWIGKEKYSGKFDDMEKEDRLNMYMQMGTKMIDDMITPEGTAGYRRR
ncbi:hypothetical protein FJZ53_06270 [Candidatus Woesearchaeota archaeon]|nr:hypothetical protein [Candidatus Woesearchaeota archaeon]